MKYLYLLVIFINSCSEKSRDFYDKVLSDLDSHSYFIALDVQIDDRNTRTIIENSNFFDFLIDARKTDSLNYKTYAVQIVLKNIDETISPHDKLEFGFQAMDSNALKKMATLNRNELLTKY